MINNNKKKNDSHVDKNNTKSNILQNEELVT